MMVRRALHESKEVEDLYGFYFSWFWVAGSPIIPSNKFSWYTVCSAFIIINNYVTMVSIVADIVVNFHDMPRVVESSRVLVPASNAILSYLIISFQRESLMKLLSFNWEGLATEVSGPMTSLLRRIKPGSLKIEIIFFAIHTVYCIARLANTKARLFTTNAYFGFDASKSPVYEIINISQYIMFWSCFMVFFAFPSLFAFLVATACSHLEMIRNRLLNLRESREMEQELRTCIRHHQKVLEFVRGLENITNKVLFVQFLLILGGMCVAAFSGAMSFGKPTHLAQAFLVYVAFLSQLYVYCWFGSELTEQAQLVSQAAYDCDWVGIPIPLQRSIIIIIAAASNEIVLTAGKFVPASRSTMLNVINQTISYLMFLINVNDGEEED